MTRFQVLRHLFATLFIVAMLATTVSTTAIAAAQSATPPVEEDIAQPVEGATLDDPAEPPPPDQDGDGIPDNSDNCVATSNLDQADGDEDGTGDACELDSDGDGTADDLDTCPALANPDQQDADGNGVGDACEVVPAPTEVPVDAPAEQIDGSPPTISEDTDADTAEAEETGTISVLFVDDAGAVVLGACFQVYVDSGGTRGDYVASACDYQDGSDGTTTLAELLPGAYIVTEDIYSLPGGYVGASDQFVVLEAGAALDLTSVHQRLGSLVVLKVGPGGAPLPGACFDLYLDAGGGALGEFVTQRCDEFDGADDGSTIFESAYGALVLVESRVPVGYLAATNLAVHVSAAEAKTVTIEDLLGGTIVARSLDGNGAVLFDSESGACFQLWSDAGGGTPDTFHGELCDTSDGASDGIVSFAGLSTGSYLLINTRAPSGYLTVPNRTASVTAGQTTGVDVVFSRGGVLVVTVLGSGGASLPGACFAVYANDGTGTAGTPVATACDGADGSDDGSVTLVGLAGSYVLVQTQTSAGYLRAPDRTFNVKAGKTHKLVVKPDLGGVITLRLVDEDGNPVPGSAFTLWTDAGGGQPGSYVYGENDGDDGVLTFTGLASGRYFLREFITPAGYLTADPTLVRVKAGKIVDVTVINRRGGDLVIRTVDQTGAPIVGTCYQLFPEGQETSIAASCDHRDGQQEILGLRTGSYVLHQWMTPFGFALSDDTVIQVVEGEITTVEVTNVELGTLVLHAVDETGQTLTEACYDVTTPTSSRGENCDIGDFGDDSVDGYVTYEHIDGTAQVVPVGAPDGHILADPFTVDVAPGETRTVDVVFALGGSIEVTSVDASGQPLPGICFNLYVNAGGGTLGDNVAGRCDGNDGMADGFTSLLGLVGGEYVLVENFPPLGYRPVENRSVHVDLGETVSVGLVHQPISILVVTKLDETDLPLPGACFKAYPDAEEIFEWQIAEFCDDADGANDGTMRHVGLEPGPYLIEEIVTPVGYLPLAAPLPFVLTEGQTTTVPVPNALGGIARVLLTGPDTAPLPGACFYLYTDNPGPNGTFVASRCDGDDGEPDGRATFVGLATGGHRVLVEAPEGYFVPNEVPFQAQAGETVDVPIAAQEMATVILRRTDSAGTPILGGCIVIYVDEGGGALGRNTGTICDGMYGDRDGMATVRFRPGAYVAVDEYPPDEYLPGPNQTFTATSGETVEVTVVSRLGGRLTIYTTNQAGDPVPGGCFAAYRYTGGEPPWEVVDSGCDSGMDGSSVDGITTLVGLEGDLEIVHTDASGGYLPASVFAISIAAGEIQEHTVGLTLGGTLRIEAVDEAGNPVVGGCFDLYRDAGDGTPTGEFLGFGCDSFDEDGIDGTTVIVGLVDADIVVIDTITPDGYLPADPTTASVSIGESTTVLVIYAA